MQTLLQAAPRQATSQVHPATHCSLEEVQLELAEVQQLRSQQVARQICLPQLQLALSTAGRSMCWMW